MRSLIALIYTFIGLVTALEHREIIHRVRSQVSYVHRRHVTRDISDSEPCSLLSEVFEAAVADGADTSQGLIVDVPPSVGIACLQSVPVHKERDLALIEHLRPYISFQSTIETLADPPEEYLLHGVDIWGGLEAIEQKLEAGEYASQYEVMTDLRSIFVAANDNHFDYPPAILNTFLYVRRNLDFISLSRNGISLPMVYHAADVRRGNHHELDYRPSHVTDIDGVPIVEWLEQDTARNTLNYQDPDAQYNNLFSSVPGQAAGKAGVTLISHFEVPDNYTVNFWNGSSLVVKNEILFPAGVDFSGIHDGEKFQEVFEVVPGDFEDDDDDDSRTPDIGRSGSSDDSDDAPIRVQGYPTPVIKHSHNSIAGYFLNDEDHQDVAVLSILSFLPIGLPLSELSTFNITEYVLEARDVIVKFVHAAQEDGRDKLVLDLSANGGGSILFAQEVYRLLFPDGEFTSYDRYRLNEALEAAAAADYEQFLSFFVSTTYPINANGEVLKNEDDFMGPFTAGEQNVTAPFQLDMSTSWATDTWINGFEPDGQMTAIPTAPFEPENIILVTDGTCASACGILTGLLTRNHGIRTLALGGRPNRLPMQSMGGVRGTLVSLSSDLLIAFKQFSRVISSSTAVSKSILADAADSIPSFSLPPLKPLIRGDAGGRVNSRNGYSSDDIDGLPLHFKYEAANGRLFYTQLMSADVRETWRRAAGVAWRGEKCVSGSTVNDDDTMGDETVAFTTAVRTQVQPLEGPGALPARW